VQQGTPLFALQEMAGWETEKMVRRCAHLAVGHLAARLRHTCPRRPNVSDRKYKKNKGFFGGRGGNWRSPLSCGIYGYLWESGESYPQIGPV